MHLKKNISHLQNMLKINTVKEKSLLWDLFRHFVSFYEPLLQEKWAVTPKTSQCHRSSDGGLSRGSLLSEVYSPLLTKLSCVIKQYQYLVIIWWPWPVHFIESSGPPPFLSSFFIWAVLCMTFIPFPPLVPIILKLHKTFKRSLNFSVLRKRSHIYSNESWDNFKLHFYLTQT